MKSLLTMLTVLACAATYGQNEFAPLGATWYYSKVENFAREEGYIKIVSERDTTIDGKQAKVLIQEHYNSDGERTFLNNMYTHQVGDRVYYWIDNDFRILYDFSLKKGDEMEIYSKEIFCSGNDNHVGKVKVDTVSSIEVNGVVLKKFTTAPTPSSVYKYPGAYVEVIGGLDGIHPVDTGCSVDMFPEIGRLRCYVDQALGHYNVPGRMPCDTLITVSAPTLEDLGIVVTYLSDAKTFSIDLGSISNANDLVVRVYNIDGKARLLDQVDPKANKVDIHVGSNGIYLLQVLNNQNIIHNEKVMAY